MLAPYYKKQSIVSVEKSGNKRRSIVGRPGTRGGANT